MALEKTIDVLGIGNAIIDVLADADDAFLLQHNLNKGSMTLVDEESSSNIYSSMKNKIQMSGGSAANTIYGLAQLGCRSAFIGKRSNDDLGNIFHSDFVISICIGMFKIARNLPKKYHLCQKPAKSGSARIWICVLTSPSGGHLCNPGHNGFQNCGKLLIN